MQDRAQSVSKNSTWGIGHTLKGNIWNTRPIFENVSEMWDHRVSFLKINLRKKKIIEKWEHRDMGTKGLIFQIVSEKKIL